MKHEQKFYDALKNIFVGAPIEGQGGYVNLLKVKETYYHSVVSALRKEIEADEAVTKD